MSTNHSRSTSLTYRAAHATWWSTLEISARYGVQVAVMILLARLLTPTEFGLIAMLLVFTSVAALLVDSGFGTALVQKQHTSDDDETTVFLAGLGISVLLGCTLWFIAPAIAHFYSQPLLVPLTRLLLFALPLSALAAVPDALLTQRLDFRSRANAEIGGSLCSGLVAIFLAWRGFGVWSLAWQSIVAIGIRGLLLWLYSHWRPRGHFRLECFRRLFAFSGYMLMANLLNIVSIRLQSLLIGRMYDSRALGYYTLAQSTQQSPAQFISSVLNRVGLPVFAAVAKDPTKLVGALQLSLRVATFVFAPCMIGLALIARPLIETLYGGKWTPAAPLLTLLSLSATLWPLHVLNLAAIGAQGRSDLIFRIELAKRLVSIGLILVFSPGGPVAIAWAVLISSFASILINTWYTHKLLGYGTFAQLRDQAATLLLSTLAALAGWLALELLPSGTLFLLITIIASALVYLSAAAVCRHAALREIFELKRILQKNAKGSGSVL